MSPSAPLALTPEQVLAFRLDRHHLLSPAADAVTAAATLLGAQAQVASAAVLQLRARCPGLSDAAADQALYGDRSLIRLWAQRSTLHLLARDDLAPILAMRRLMVPAYHRWYQGGGLTTAQVDILLAAVAGALADGPHSRMDLSRRLTPRLGDWAAPWLEHSWGGVLKLGAALGQLCHGPEPERDLEPDPERAAGNRGETLFVGLESWLGHPLAIPDSRPALAGLLARYLAVYGPAGPADFRKFTGIPTAFCRQAYTDLAADLLPVAVAGRALWALARDEDALRTAAPPPGHLAVLPLFDPWLLAHADSGLTVDAALRPAVYRTAGWISAVVLRQGRVVATWRHQPTAGRTAWRVTLAPFARLRRGERAVILDRLRHLSGGLPVRLESPA